MSQSTSDPELRLAIAPVIALARSEATGRPWQAEYWISSVRDQALTLGCRRRGLEVSYGRGFDELPAGTLALGSAALVRSLEREELLHALRAAVDAGG